MESVQNSLAKLTKPRLQKVLPRYRLFSLLDESRSYPAIWVSGPGGSGKTTLLSSYIDEYQLPCLWYKIDESDSDIATFFYYMRLAAKKIAPGRIKDLPLLSPEYAQSVPAFTRRYFEELFDRLEKPGILVLDNFQEVSQEDFHSVLRNTLDVIPEHTNLFILSRVDPPASLARARASSLLCEIAWPELRLQAQELCDMVRLLSRNRYSDEFIDYLHQKTDGWIAGLLLLLKWAKIEEIDNSMFTRLTEHEVFDYFLSEIFASADPEVQQFLLTTAILPQMTAGMAEKLTGMPRAAELLSSMSRNHWFTDRHLGREEVYQYHPMFREFLLSRASESLTADRLTGLKEKAARLMKNDGQVEAAIVLFFETGNFRNAIELIFRRARQMVLQGRIQTLEEWLRRLPDEIIGTHPRVLYWLGACRLYIDPPEGRNFFEKALSYFESQGDRSGALFCVCGVMDSTAFGFNSFEPLDPWISKLSARSGEFESLPSPEIRGRVTFTMFHALVLRQPDHPEFGLWKQRGLEILQNSASAELKIRLILPFILNCICTGELTEAEYFISTYRETAKSPDVPPLALISLKNLEAFYCWTSGNFAACRKVVTSSLEMAPATSVHLAPVFLLAHGAACALSSGDPDGAGELLESMEHDVCSTAGWIRETFHAMMLWKALLEKDPPRALLNGKLAVKESEKAGMPFSAAVSHFGLSLALQASGKLVEAAAQVDRALRICRSLGSRQVEFACCLAWAEFALDLGDESGALVYLKEAMAIGNARQYLNTWFWRPEAMARLCCKALEAGIEVDYVHHLIRKRNLIPETPPLEIENWPWPVKLFTLGRFAVVKDGVPLSFSQKVQEKPLALLRAIISLGGRDVSVNSIIDFLWPEADGDAAYGAFKTTLHRLRKLLGHHEAVRVNTGGLTLDQRYCWVDAWIFERRLSQADAAWHSGGNEADSARAVALITRALELYKGPLFKSEDDRPNPLRERLHARYLKAVEQLGRYWQECGKWEKAIDLYESGIQCDAFAESFYRELMVCHHQLGQWTRAMGVYERCRTLLAAHPGTRPSREIEAVKNFLCSQRNQ
ncbi:MAG: hypothetical protein K9K62_07870 [Desulfobacteraceae bacterium]|nr:hypothetical protein [Desulfobacteraceae bacterium]